MEEEWRDIKGYEGLYQVSNLGRVRSLDKAIVDSKGRKRISKGRIRRVGVKSGGYLNVALCKNGKAVNKSVHRLVAEAFMPDADFSLDVHHINGVRHDNRIENLRFVTERENNVLRSWPTEPEGWKGTGEHVNSPREQIINLPGEEWMPVKGFEGIYEVSNMGRVKSVERDIVNRNGKTIHWNEALLSQHIVAGYLKVSLSKEGKTHLGLVHRLVATAFVAPIEGKNVVDHINCVKTDNRAENLRWVTYSENNKYAHENGLHDKEAMRKRGREHVAKHGTATPPKPVIRSDGVWFESEAAAGRALGVGQSSISAVVIGKNRTCKGYSFKFAEQAS